jgi:hypothetical protein
MDGSGLFVSSCSRRQLARRRAGRRFWGMHQFVRMTRGAYSRLSGSGRMSGGLRR